MKRWSGAQFWRATEFAYAILALFALTQGPVYRLWSQSALLVDSLPSPSIPHAYFATFVALQLPAAVLLARRAPGSWFALRSNQALVALLAWIGLSVLWSSFARHSLPEFVALVLTTVFGVYLATSFSLRQFWVVVASAMAFGVGVSWVAVMRLWDGAFNFLEGYWIGIYFNRNSLAPVAAVAMIAAVGLVVSAWQPTKDGAQKWLIIAAVPAAMLFAFSAIELRQSESQTSPLAIVTALLVCLLWLFLRRLAGRNSRLSPLLGLSAGVTLVIAAVALFVALRLGVLVGGVETATTAFNQRSGLWSISWEGFRQKPWLGWGWFAAWRDPLFLLSMDEPTWMAWGLEWSHSGYFDLLLGGGVPAAAIFAAFVWLGSQRISQSRDTDGLSMLLLVAYVLAAATQESFFIGSHFLWALLVAGLSATPDRRLVD
jgi:O-antigen ligase